ncbi:MAG: hypothetical protein ACRCZB_07600 [Bacteroidales bacterium]
MSKAQCQRRRQIKQSRLEIIAEMYKRGNSMRKIQTEVVRRLGLRSCSIATIHSDIQTLLSEWRESRIQEIDLAVQLELERIDDTVCELWGQWEKSKQDYTQKVSKRKGAPVKDKGGDGKLSTVAKEEQEQDIKRLGNIDYIVEIRKQLTERRKLLGMYAPEKLEASLTEYDLSGLSEKQKNILASIGEKVINAKE